MQRREAAEPSQAIQHEARCPQHQREAPHVDVRVVEARHEVVREFVEDHQLLRVWVAGWTNAEHPVGGACALDARGQRHHEHRESLPSRKALRTGAQPGCVSVVCEGLKNLKR